MIPLPRWMIPYGFIGLGALFLIYGAGHLWRTYEFESRALTAEATVAAVRVERTQGAFDQPGEATARIYRPVLVFEDQTGALRRVASDRASSMMNYPVGQTMRIVYDPLDPDFVRFDSGTDIWIGAGVQVFMGAIALTVGLWLRSLMRSAR